MCVCPSIRPNSPIPIVNSRISFLSAFSGRFLSTSSQLWGGVLRGGIRGAISYLAIGKSGQRSPDSGQTAAPRLNLDIVRWLQIHNYRHFSWSEKICCKNVVVNWREIPEDIGWPPYSRPAYPASALPPPPPQLQTLHLFDEAEDTLLIFPRCIRRS